MGDQPRGAVVGDVDNDKAGVAPAAVGRIGVHDRMVQAETADSRRPGLLARGKVHAGKPETACFFRLSRIGHINRNQDIRIQCKCCDCG